MRPARQRPGVLAALLLVLALAPVERAAAAPPRALPTILQDDALLLHRPRDEVAATMQRLRALGVDRVRISAVWSALAPEPDAEVAPAFDAADPAAYDQPRWHGLDTAVREAAAAGLPVLLDLGLWAPAWAAQDTGPRARTGVDPPAFAAFAEAVVRRYSGTFAPPGQGRGGDDPAPLPAVDLVALWNEPNHQAFLFPTWERLGAGWVPSSPHHYRAMAALAHDRIEAARPDVRVLVGNTSSTGGSGGRAPVPPLRFIRELACVDEALRPRTDGPCAAFRPVEGDGFAHHPYAPAASPARTAGAGERDAAFLGDLRRMRTLLRRLVRRGRLARGLADLWITEVGWETPGGGAPATVSEEDQARFLAWGEHVAAAAGARSFAQFLLRDVPPSPFVRTTSVRRPGGQFATGLERADGTPKAAARAFRIGLFAVHRSRSTTRLWARLRLADRPVDVRFEREDPLTGRWTRLGAVRAPGRGAVALDVARTAEARFRIVVFGARSRPVVGRPVWPEAPASGPGASPPAG